MRQPLTPFTIRKRRPAARPPRAAAIGPNGGDPAAAIGADHDTLLSGKAGRVYREIERRLTEGRYRFGDSISVSEIVAETGVSRQPVMAALAELRANGFIAITPQVGCRVVTPSERDIGDFFALYGTMEGQIASLACARWLGDEIDEIDEALARMRRMKIVAGTVSLEFVGKIREFHRLIDRMAHSPAVTRYVDGMRRMSEFLLFNGAPNLRPGRIALANREREAIVIALKGRATKRAQQLMEAHIRGRPERMGIIGSGRMAIKKTATEKNAGKAKPAARDGEASGV